MASRLRVTVLALLPACGIPRSSTTSEATPAPVEPTPLRVVERSGKPVAILTFHLGAGAAQEIAVEGLRLEADGKAARFVPFLDSQPIASGVRLVCEAAGEHHAQVAIVHLLDGRFEVTVQDEVGARTRLVELSVGYAAPALVGAEDRWLPGYAGPGGAGDASFFAPIALLRSGDLGLGLVAGTSTLREARPLPQFLDLDARSGELRHGLRSEAAEGRIVQGQVLRFRHHLAAAGGGRGVTALGDLLSKLWLEAAASRLEQWPGPCRLPVAEHSVAEAACNRILDQPWRGGLLASATGSYRSADAAWEGYWLLRATTLVPERKAKALEVCARTAQMLCQSQRASGAFPSRFDPPHFTPTREAGIAECGDTGIVALFLVEYAKATGDRQALEAGRRALRHAWSRLTAGEAWATLGTLERLAAEGRQQRDARGLGVRDGLALAATALAAARWFEATSDAEASRIAEGLRVHLAGIQLCWQPEWLDSPPLGSLAASTSRPGEVDPDQALAALAWLAGYRQSGRREWLQRAAAVLRADFARAPGGSDRTRDAVAAEVLREWGQGVVDLRGQFAVGFADAWCEDLAVEGDLVAFELLTTAAATEPVRFMLAGAGRPRIVVCNGEDLGILDADTLESGILLAPRRVARVTFQPPASLRAGADWRPRARVSGPRPDRVVAELLEHEQSLARLELEPGQGEEWSAARPFPGILLDGSRELSVRLVVQEADRRTALPNEQGASLRLGRMDTIVPGHDDEWELSEAGRSRPVRLRDPDAAHRRIDPGDGVTYRLQVDPAMTGIEIELRLQGRARVAAGSLTLHVDEEKPTEPMRELSSTLQDRRLWEDGSLELRIECGSQAAEPLALFAIRHRPLGRVAEPDPTVGRTERIAPTRAAIRVSVFPVAFADQALGTTRSDLQQAFFGGPKYLQTPPPNPQRTAGSVAELVARLSGGRTRLEGDVAQVVRLPLSISDLPPGEEGRRLVLAELLRRVPAYATNSQTLVVVHPAAAPLQGSLDHVLCVAERAPDDSYLATSDVLRGMLTTSHGLRGLDDPAHGNFGTLALNGARGQHTPAGLIGPDLAQLGWADVVRVDAGEDWVPLSIAPLYEGRRAYRLPAMPLLGGDELLLELRADSPADAGLSGHGLLAIWRHGPQGLLLQRLDGRAVLPELTRLSASRSLLEAPFAPGDSLDLWQRVASWSGLSSPGLANAAGDALFEIRGLDAGGPQPTGSALLEVRRLAQDLRPRLLTWRSGNDEGDGVPLLVGESPVPGQCSVKHAGDGLELRLVSGARLEGLFDLPVREPARLLGALRRLGGEALVSLSADGVEMLAFRCVDQPRRFSAILGGGTPQVKLVLRAQALAEGATLRLDELWLVPRTRSVHRVPAEGDLSTRNVVLQDGCLHDRTLRLPAGVKDKGPERFPVVLPAGQAWIRIVAGFAQGVPPGAEARLTLELGTLADSGRIPLLRRALVRRETGDQPLFCALAELPAGDRRRAAFLEVRVDGDPAHALHFTTLAVERQ
jgi:hypothetical protein